MANKFLAVIFIVEIWGEAIARNPLRNP